MENSGFSGISRAAPGEQRIALRPRPREIVTVRHRLNALGMARASKWRGAGLRGNGWFHFGSWRCC